MTEVCKFTIGATDECGKGRWIEGAVRSRDDDPGYTLTAHLYCRPSGLDALLICNRVSLTIARPFAGVDFWALVRPMTTDRFAVTGDKRWFECDEAVRPKLEADLTKSALQHQRGEADISPELESEVAAIKRQLVDIRKRELMHMAFASFQRSKR